MCMTRITENYHLNKTNKTGRCIMSMKGQPFLPSVKGLLQAED